MKNILVKTRLAAASMLVMTGLLSTLVIAQDEDEETNRVRMEERRVEMQQRRAEFLENNPEAAARMEERLAQMRERFEKGEGRPRGPRPGFDGRRPGPPAGGPRFREGDNQEESPNGEL